MPDLSPPHLVALHLTSTWMSERYFRTFRPVAATAAGSPASDAADTGDATAEGGGGPFDAVLQQRDRRVGVTIGALWDEGAEADPGNAAGAARDLAEMLTGDLLADPASERGAYVVWVPPKAVLPTTEPQISTLRLALARGLSGLPAGERREVRLPLTLVLAKLTDEGAYVSVTGGLAPEWTSMSEGVAGSFHLDSRALSRLPEERAEIDLILTRVRDRAALLEPGEVTDVQVTDTWTVSRLATGAAGATAPPEGVSVIAVPAAVDPQDGTLVRRMLRRHVQRAVAQHEAARAAGEPADMAALILLGAIGHLKDELATAALRGMNPAAYGILDLITIVADGGARQVLQPRTLPWEAAR